MGTLNKTIGHTHSGLSQANQVATQFLRRMAQFAILLPIFATLNQAIQGSVKFMAEFELELAKIVRIDPSKLTDRMSEISDTALQIAKDFGSTGDKVIGSIRIFKQAGDSIEEAMDKARVATLASVVTTLDLANAQEILIAVNKQFANEALTNEEVLDKLTKAEDSAAITAQDMAEALRTGGNALSFAAKSFDDAIGLISALREQTRKSGREVGTFFKTLSARILAAGESKSAIEALGVTVVNLDGSLRPLLSILSDLAIKFDTLTESEAASAAKAIAGVRQFESFIATLQSVGRAQELSAGSAGAADTAQKQLAVTSETLTFKTNQMISSFQKLAQTSGESGLLDIFKQAADFASEIAEALGAAVTVADKLGIAIGPLLAIGAIKIGQRAFGFGGGGGGAASGGTAVLGQAAKQSAISVNTLGIASTQTARSFQGLPNIINKTNQAQERSVGVMLGVIAGGVLVSNGLNLLAGQLGKASSATAQYVASQLQSVGSSIQTGTAFFTLGKTLQQSLKIGAFAAATQFVIGTMNDLAKATRENINANKELAELAKKSAARETLKATGQETGIFDKLLDTIGQELESSGGKLTGVALQNIKTTFKRIASEFENLKGLDIEEVIASPDLLRQIAAFNPELIKLNAAIEGGAPGTRLFGFLIEDLKKKAAEAGEEIITLGDGLSITARSVQEVKELKKIAQLEADIAQQRNELIAVTSKQLTLFESEITIRQRELEESKNFLSIADDTISRLKSLAQSSPLETVGVSGDAATEFVGSLEEAFKSVGPNIRGFLTRTLSDDRLNNLQKEFAQDFIEALKARRDEEIKIETAAFKVRESIAKAEFDRQQALSEVTKKTNEVFDTMKQSLVDLGIGAEATSGDLQTLQNLSVDDLNAILDGTSKLGVNIKNAVGALAGDEITQAETDITKASQSAAIELEALKNQLDVTKKALANIKDGFSQVTGESEDDLIKQSGELSANIMERRGQLEIELAKLGINRAIAIQKAEEESAKKAKELQEALDKLADAEKKVVSETKDISKEFKDFIDSKIADFASADADAQNELKQAEEEVLSATKELSDSYKELDQAILDFNDNLAAATIESNLLGVQISTISGGLSTFQSRLGALDNAFNSVLMNANISLQQRIELERQLAEETLSFLQNAKSEIISAGTEVFGQTGEENRALSEGIQGLRFIADQLGGSFEKFLQIEPGDFNELSNKLLNLPVEFRQNILSALSTLPDTVSVGGFSVEELRTAIGQIGAGIAPEEGLPSVEELIEAESAQIEELRDLAIKDAELQFASVAAAQEQLDISKAQLEEAEIMKERAEENAISVREAILEEKAVLDAANEQRQLLTEQILAATNESALEQIQAQAEKFAEQNAIFGEIGDQIVGAIESLAAVQSQALEAGSSVPSTYRGHIPNFIGGNLSRREVGGLLRAASIEKRHMPGGAGLAVANTSEAIIPTRNKGYIPNFQSGNFSEIGAGISAIKGINETVVAAISRSVGEALADLTKDNNEDNNRQVVDVLGRVLDELQNISVSSAAISTNTEVAQTTNATSRTASDLRVDINMNQRDTVQVTGLNSLVGELESGIRRAQEGQTGTAVKQIEGVVTEIAQVLRERGLISSLGQPG
jgi:TP901 family phage tail tape measure protein